MSPRSTVALGALEIAQNQTYVLCLCKDLSSRPSTPWLSEHCQVQPGGPQHCQGSSGGLASLCLSSTTSTGLCIEPHDPKGQVSPGVVPWWPLEHCSGTLTRRKNFRREKKAVASYLSGERDSLFPMPASKLRAPFQALHKAPVSSPGTGPAGLGSWDENTYGANE